MDGVILAAGRGSRVAEIGGLHMKPLLPINGGSSLFERHVELVEPRVERLTVVASPYNVAAICDILDARDSRALVVVQSNPRGAGHALLLGVSACRARDDLVLVTLSSDLISKGDIDALTATSEKCYGSSPGVGIRWFPRDEAAQKYTFYDSDGTWREKVSPLSSELYVPCWVGLFIGSLGNMNSRLHEILHSVDGGEMRIGPHLGDFMYAGRNRLVGVTAQPIKTLEDYQRIN